MHCLAILPRLGLAIALGAICAPLSAATVPEGTIAAIDKIATETINQGQAESDPEHVASRCSQQQDHDSGVVCRTGSLAIQFQTIRIQWKPLAVEVAVCFENERY
jgi:hypothetical protein